jgi:hypothetical protein
MTILMNAEIPKQWQWNGEKNLESRIVSPAYAARARLREWTKFRKDGDC